MTDWWAVRMTGWWAVRMTGWWAVRMTGWWAVILSAAKNLSSPLENPRLQPPHVQVAKNAVGRVRDVGDSHADLPARIRGISKGGDFSFVEVDRHGVSASYNRDQVGIGQVWRGCDVAIGQFA